MAAVAVSRRASLSSTSISDSDLFYQKRPGSLEMASLEETPYPVVVFDGEKHVDAGHVGIHSGTQFKALQVALSQKTGVPPKKISAALVCRRGSKSSEKRRQKKLPINEKTNFPGILTHHNPLKEKDCFLLVTTRKSGRGRERRLRSRRNVVDDDGDCSGSSRDDLSPPVNPYSAPPTGPEKPLIVRDPTPAPTAGILDPSSFRIYPPGMNRLLGTMHDNRMVMEPFVTRNLPAYVFEYTYTYAYTAYTTSARRARIAVCETCTEAGDGREVAFHPCVLDEVLEVWHRSPPAGPIQRPSKPGSSEAAA